ncbi:hypothetical protein XthCFBP4691_17850 [Xanthomonas theicola]|uniref:Phosphodiester glycosidase domain-containing protein n=2 Tax=Xanthomonas theicola TaxID=56464 RepID=A0A2S6ZB67_9XANT|nr:hypothetical protein XthCFBP4691_17850 [Xanthomonas theicola]QNH27127.1 phosphodiester glycosidase family protein [Xanthomonas theicola]
MLTLGGALLAASACAAEPAPAVPAFVPMETVLSADCWGAFADDVLQAVRDCRKADGTRIALQVADAEAGPARAGFDARCAGARCADLAQLLQVAPQRRLLLRTPPRRIDAVLAAVQAASAGARVAIEPQLQRPQGASAPIALAQGVRYWRSARSTPAPAMLHIAQIDLRTPGLELVGTPGDRSGGKEFVATPTSAFVREHGLALAINADYFLPFDGGRLLDKAFVPLAGSGVTAEGLAISDGRLASDTRTEDARVDGAFCAGARGARIVRGGCPRGTRVGIGAGPLLLLDGKRQPREASRAAYYDEREPRTALGLDAARQTLWLVVVDGRQPHYSEGMTLDELSAVFEQLGARSAMNLDGGGSSTMAARVDGQVRVLNSSIHTGIPGRERPVANQLGIRARP